MSLVERYQPRLRSRHEVECSLRVVDGQHEGLSRRWRAGVARIDPGVISFRRGIGGLRLHWPRATWTPISVVEVPTQTTRVAERAELIWVNSAATILAVQAATASLEWAMRPGEVGWILDRLDRPPAGVS